MNTTDPVQFATTRRTLRPAVDLPAIAPSYHQLVPPVRSAIVRARRLLLRRQRHDGCWAGHQISDASLPSQLVLLLAYLGREDTELADQAANAILRDQREGGGWSAAPGGRPELSISVQAYFALKMAGNKANRPHMAAARQVIRQLGGADGADATTRMFLMLFGQIDYGICGCDASSHPWMVSCPRQPVEFSRGVRELFVANPEQWPRMAEESPQRGASFLNFVWQAIAQRSQGADQAPATSEAWKARLRQFIVVDQEHDEARPCLGMSPAIDTALVREALLESGIRAERCGSLSRRNWPSAAVADTFELAALARLQSTNCCRLDTESALPPEIQVLDDRRVPKRSAKREALAESDGVEEPLARIVDELLSRQNSDGGWSAGRPHHAPSDPAATASVLESVSHRGLARTHEAVRRGATHLQLAQRADGSWDSASGVRYIHGTSLVVRGRVAAGVSHNDLAVEAGVNWLQVHQQESGGWGEAAPPSKAHCEFVPAQPSAIQTAWAVSALVAAGRASDDATLLGVQFLVETQEADGDWNDSQFTLRDPAAGKNYRNDLHSAAESLAALARWAVSAASHEPESTSIRLKLVAEETAFS
jgi:squalene-hopene/tetraprenyl-beta-curcumene cyclase